MGVNSGKRRIKNSALRYSQQDIKVNLPKSKLVRVEDFSSIFEISGWTVAIPRRFFPDPDRPYGNTIFWASNWFFGQPVGTRDDYKLTAHEVAELLKE